MGIIFGYLSLFCFILLVVKICIRKFRCTKTDKILAKLHKPLCIILILSCLLHLILVAPVFKTRNFYIYVTGISAVSLLVSIIIVCHVKRNDITKRMQWHRILAWLMFLCVMGHTVIYCIDFRNYQTRINNIQLQHIDFSNIADGQYIGEYDAGYIDTTVQVIISDGTIRDVILLKHENERGQTAEKILSNIVDAQTFPVDAITGATNSSKVIQKAVQNALEGAIVKE